MEKKEIPSVHPALSPGPRKNELASVLLRHSRSSLPILMRTCKTGAALWPYLDSEKGPRGLVPQGTLPTPSPRHHGEMHLTTPDPPFKTYISPAPTSFFFALRTFFLAFLFSHFTRKQILDSAIPLTILSFVLSHLFFPCPHPLSSN